MVNPLLSLTHQDVYGIPMLLMFGWRGQPGLQDEPQHMVQGKCMKDMLTDCDIPFTVVPGHKELAMRPSPRPSAT